MLGAEISALKGLWQDIKKNPAMIISGIVKSPITAIKALLKIVVFGIFLFPLLTIVPSVLVQSVFGDGILGSIAMLILMPVLLLCSLWLLFKWLTGDFVAKYQSLDTHGSAKFAGTKEISDLKSTDGLLIGRDTKSHKLLRYGDSSHLLTIAPTRTGKGVGTIVPNLLTLDRSIICIDPKGENAAIARRARASRGPVYVLDPFEAVPGTRSSFNPLEGINPEGVDIADDVAALADALVYDAPGESGEAHWNDEAKALIGGLLLYIIAAESNERRNLSTLREYLTLAPDDFAALLSTMQQSTAAFGLIARAANRHLGKSDKEASGVLSSAQRHTHFLDSPRMGAILGRSDFNFRDLKTGIASVFLVLPPERLASYSRWLRLMVTQSLRDLSTDHTKPTKPILYLLDEFAALGHLASIEQAMGLMAGYGIQLWPILQDIHQLRAIYGQRFGTFLSNAGVLQFFGVTDHESALMVSNLLGQETVSFETESQQSGSMSSSSSEQRTGRALMTPDEVRRLPATQQLLFVAGRAPILAAKLRYFDDPEFAGMFDSEVT